MSATPIHRPPSPPLTDAGDSPAVSKDVPTAIDATSSKDKDGTSTLHGLGFDIVFPETRGVSYERKMGDSELSYYLPSRANGVNDMYLHLGFRAPEHLVRRARVRTVWAILRNRHPLLAAEVEMHDYDDVRFVYKPPTSPESALLSADQNLDYQTHTKDELLDNYLNGPRTLSNTRISYLIVSQPNAQSGLPTPPASPGTLSESSSTEDLNAVEYDLLICAAHFIGDGMALHQFAHDFFTLLGSEKTQDDLNADLEGEWKEKWGAGKIVEEGKALPKSMEEYLPLKKGGRFRAAAAKIDFKNSQDQLIGGQSFPRRKSATRKTVVPTVSFDEERTKAMLKKCKANGVSVSVTLFAICNIAWARLGGVNKELPMMMYSALNLRPYFPLPLSHPSYWYLAVGYFNVVLPSFLPTAHQPDSKTFWHRSRLAKDQCGKAAKNKMVVDRTREMALERGVRARGWAKEDDDKEKMEKGLLIMTPPPPAAPTNPKVPSYALIGLSLLGNLDSIYKHPSFPSLKLHTLTTGSRQRGGGMLMFGYTFAGKMWVSLGYDEEGFEKETVDRFWKGVLDGVDEFLG
ncbi:hypothetical protein JAAARDRAFT_119702 [Jaapia argillacea MUCL 33604]|uniref:Uncharacterized protein n=1 Tax=Jaapia argillacea MUCL 33604 TaxID=933084 RepID=A0A067QKX2_9AGAM|nr:hypothetical protein JAAARDRAFT_119702 [Jaapia argillacea MUCL 33604]